MIFWAFNIRISLCVWILRFIPTNVWSKFHISSAIRNEKNVNAVNTYSHRCICPVTTDPTPSLHTPSHLNYKSSVTFTTFRQDIKARENEKKLLQFSHKNKSVRTNYRRSNGNGLISSRWAPRVSYVMYLSFLPSSTFLLFALSV